MDMSIKPLDMEYVRPVQEKEKSPSARKYDEQVSKDIEKRRHKEGRREETENTSDEEEAFDVVDEDEGSEYTEDTHIVDFKA